MTTKMRLKINLSHSLLSISIAGRLTSAVVSYQIADSNVRIRLAPQPPGPAIGKARIIQ